MIPILLILLFILFFLVSCYYLVRQDDLLAVYYICLFIYTVFTQIGYVIYPDVAIQRNVYYGEDIFYDYWLFITLSFVAVFISFVFVIKGFGKKPSLSIIHDPSTFGSIIFYLLITAFLAFMLNDFISNRDNITYISVTSSDGGQLQAYLFGMLDLVILALYAKFRRHSEGRMAKLLALVYFVSSLSLFMAIIAQMGDRSSIVSLSMGIAAYELLPLVDSFGNRRRLLLLGLTSIATIMIAQRIATIRGLEEFSFDYLTDRSIVAGDASDYQLDSFKSLVGQDFFAPSTLLLASMRYGYINTEEVIRSNFYNTLIFQNYPYLSETVGALAYQTSRKQGAAYYTLVEGYNIAGWWGILYNGIIIAGLLTLWRRIAYSNNPDYTKYIMAVAISLLIPMVRGQTSYLLKNIYLELVPAIVLFYLASSFRPSFNKPQLKGDTWIAYRK